MSEKITKAHDDARQLIEVIHYDAHPARTESAEFRKVKEWYHHEIKAGNLPACWIGNGHCDGNTEIHHYLVEYSAGTEVDWQKVNGVFLQFGVPAIHPALETPDGRPNLVQLCEKHHRGVGFGIHEVTFPAWILQKFMNEQNLLLFEQAVQLLKTEKHPNHGDPEHHDRHLVNAKAASILHKLGAA